MIKKKVCMLGAFAVGKTSLVQRYVNSIFSEKYKTTLGVKIDVKNVDVGDKTVELMLWDLAGEDEFMSVRTSYLRGSSGIFLVADGTRAETLDIAIEIHERIKREIGDPETVLLLNKSDLHDAWSIQPETVNELEKQGWKVIKTSAKDSHNIEYAFETLAESLLSVKRDNCE